MKRRSFMLTWIGVFTCLALVASAAVPIKPEQFDSLRAVIKPQAGEDKWAGIPWRTDLWEARKEAAAQGKPILLWEMDGHPLGCG
jgi:hypothetical protein